MDNSNHQSAWSKSLSMKEQRRIVMRLVKFATRFKWYFFISIILAAGVSVVNILLPRLIQIYMDQHLRVGDSTLNMMWFFAGLYFFGMLMKAIMQFWQTYLYSMGAEYMLESVRRNIFKKLHGLGMRYFDQTPGGSILSRLTNDTMSFSNFWALFSSLILVIFGVISSFIAMFLVDRKIALWLLILMPFLILSIWYYQKYSSVVYRRMRERLSELNAKLAESITGVSVIQQFRQEGRIESEFEQTNGRYFDTRKAMIRVNSLLLSPIIDLLYGLATVVALSMFGIRGLHGYVAAGVIYAFVTYIDNFFNPMTGMMDNLSDFQDGIVAGSRVLKLLDDPTAEPQQNPQKGLKIQKGEIEFQHVSFSYDGKNEILHDISFKAKAGQTIALVGETGSGKTSIINVLMRFYEFGTGKILLDGQDIRTFPIAELRRRMGLVLQEPFMFYGTIASNIRMFNPEISDHQIRKAARFVQADRFIERLPKGYDNRVFERGLSYSSGQRQLISYARVIVTDPKILILDEATANIDTETEQMIQEGLEKIQEGRTTIAIAHRLSTIQNADLILVLEHGNIVERGTNNELMAKKGYYYDMIQLQGRTSN
ncbi:hypothetical protein C5L31_001554 [Secundilactobacillus malefermentans]|uniref:ABC transporter ATP-binding protein n=1 Tax=Secundilactobacillus malefermentans TaxID=176292 RepID=A0A4R5NU78_9LACO|nr:ABC transporter ATP-binding protein [Secundilactobacillus malefermentans]KRM57046.1 xenobiotic-transporting ATPase [Secundilactobacillus malefermentans DSM 5705 = KCTC 3548]TDG80527.1 hypothetical protein C5L31_001554 [Secundilactobacillus malefermentans]